MHTEDEAKELWCPLTGRDPQMMDSLHSSERCIASKCAAWRWVVSDKTDREMALAAGHGSGAPGRGYCGLSGKPE